MSVGIVGDAGERMTQQRVCLAELGVAQALGRPPLALFELKEIEMSRILPAMIRNRRPGDAAHCRFGSGNFAGPDHGRRSIASRTVPALRNSPALEILLAPRRKIGDSRAVKV